MTRGHEISELEIFTKTRVRALFFTELQHQPPHIRRTFSWMY
jgi:hypothetical protein